MGCFRLFHASGFQALSLAFVLAGCSLGSAADDDDTGDSSGDSMNNGDGDNDGDGDGDGDGQSSCLAPEYGDGTCQLDIPCAEPDIDCFLTFDTQEAAEQFFLSFEELNAEFESRDPRAIVPSTDPRFGRMKTLLDQGWQAYQAVNPVGDLARASPALVVIEDPEINAFVIPDIDTGLAGLAVIVHTGTLDQDQSDEALLGLVMHELEHVLGLHVVGDTTERLRTFYIADGDEPLGFQQSDDPVARDHGETWRSYAQEIGVFDQLELNGLPSGGFDLLSTIFFAVINEFLEEPDCIEPINDYFDLLNEIYATFSEFTGGITIDDPFVVFDADDVMDALRDECLPDFDQSFVDVFAGLVGITPDELRAQLSPYDLALVEGVHFIDAVRQFELDRRVSMQAVKGSFTDTTGLPFSSLRFFSIEEAADDATVPVLDHIGLTATGLGEFLFFSMSAEGQDDCSDALDFEEVPPYGDDLLDEHHATCWRVAHIDQLAASGEVTGQNRARPRSSLTARLRRQAPAPVPGRLPKLPPKPSDLVVY